MKRLIIGLALLAGSAGGAQVSNPSIVSVQSLPASCVTGYAPTWLVISTGLFYTCQGGVPTLVAGGSGTFTALTGDATSTATGGATEVVGLLGHALPALTTGYPNWNGTAWVFSAGGSMVYPAAGIGNSTGSAWGTSYSSTNTIPANFISTLNQNTTGTAANITATTNSTLTTLSSLALPIAQVTGGAPLASPSFTGTPLAPTATAGTNTTQISTTAFTTAAVAVETSRAETAEALKAPLASPTFTGTATAPTFAGALTGNATTATNISTNGTANQVWGMNSGATAQGWQTVSGSSTYPAATYYGLSTGSAWATSHLSDASGTITSSEPISVSGSTQGISFTAGTTASGAAGTVVYGVDSTNGYAEVNENNTGLARVCTAANSSSVTGCGSGSGTITGSGTTNDIAVFTGTTAIGNSLLTDNATTLTYTGTGGLNLSGTGAVLKVGSSAPTVTPGTAGGQMAAVGTAPTLQSSYGGWYPNSTNTCFDVYYGTSDGGCVLTTAVAASTYAPLASPTFTGTPAAPTATAGTSTTQIATTAFATTALALKAPLASPALTGTPTAPTASVGTNTTQVATTAYVIAALPVSAAITSATGGTGTGTVTCLTATCTNLRGTYSVAGGTFTTGTFLTLVWPTTTTAYACTVTQNGGATTYGIGHSVATATGMTITSAVTIASTTITLDYSCKQ